MRNQFKADKFWDFHQKLLGTRGQIGKTQALAVAKDLDADMEKHEKDLAAPAIKESIQEVALLADQLNLTGTPSFVIGQDVVVGAIPYDEMKTKVDNVHKCGKVAC